MVKRARATRYLLLLPVLLLALCSQMVLARASSAQWPDKRVDLLISGLSAGDLKTTLENCSASAPEPSSFSISHRGAPLHYPEHTREGYIAAAQMGAGIIECDVTFTGDRELVCRHSQCDLHTTTNILETPLAAKCSNPPDANSKTPYSDVKCCTSDLTLSEFKTLQGKKDYGNKKARSLQEYLYKETEGNTDYPAHGTLLTHAESIELFDSLSVQMIPELKQPQVPMPYQDTFTQQDYAQALVDEYKAANIAPEQVTLQSFNLADIEYWLDTEPDFGKRAAWLDGRYRDRSFKVSKPATWKPSMQQLVESGVTTLAPPMWMLLDLNDKKIVPSAYAVEAKAAGLELVAWTLERSGSLSGGGGWYYQTVGDVISKDSDTLTVLHALANDVGVKGVFSDWPATTSYYASCVR